MICCIRWEATHFRYQKQKYDGSKNQNDKNLLKTKALRIGKKIDFKPQFRGVENSFGRKKNSP